MRRSMLSVLVIGLINSYAISSRAGGGDSGVIDENKFEYTIASSSCGYNCVVKRIDANIWTWVSRFAFWDTFNVFSGAPKHPLIEASIIADKAKGVVTFKPYNTDILMYMKFSEGLGVNNYHSIVAGKDNIGLVGFCQLFGLKFESAEFYDRTIREPGIQLSADGNEIYRVGIAPSDNRRPHVNTITCVKQ